jgi:hypothetical protein
MGTRQSLFEQKWINRNLEPARSRPEGRDQLDWHAPINLMRSHIYRARRELVRSRGVNQERHVNTRHWGGGGHNKRLPDADRAWEIQIEIFADPCNF